MLLIPGDEDARTSSGVDEAVAVLHCASRWGRSRGLLTATSPGRLLEAGGKRPAAVSSKLERAATAAEDELEHTVLR